MDRRMRHKRTQIARDTGDRGAEVVESQLDADPAMEPQFGIERLMTTPQPMAAH